MPERHSLARIFFGIERALQKMWLIATDQLWQFKETAAARFT
jgi:hypothetical protein